MDHRENKGGQFPCSRHRRIKKYGSRQGKQSIRLSLPFLGICSNIRFEKDDQAIGDMDFFQILIITSL